MNNLPRLPVRYLADNSELLKSMEVLSGGQAGQGTDYEPEDLAQEVPPGVVSSFNAPVNRMNGNVVFRRLPNGDLDLENAKHIVVDLLHLVKDKQPLTEIEKLILGCMFPLMFPFVDPRLAAPIMSVQLRLAPWECALVTEKVAAHLQAEMSYNSGIGGGGDPGRSHTRS
jgi:hypothetical protein